MKKNAVKRPLAAAVAMIVSSLSMAQEPVLEEIRVFGRIVQGEQKALEIQRESKRIMNVIVADGIGKLPDRNAAEAVQRIPGISIERDQGEGRFVAVRGLPSQWSSTTLNGDRIPTAEEETTNRATAFDFFPSELIKRVEVSKALTPDMEGDAIGGAVNFVTRTAPDEQTFMLSAALPYNEKADESGHNINILYGDQTEDGRWGFLVNGMVWERPWATDNIEPRRGNDGIGIRRLELRDYTGERTTTGGNAAVEFNPNDNHHYYVRGMYGTLEDKETHYKHRYRFDKDRVEVQNIFNDLITEMRGGELGGEHVFADESRLSWKLARYENAFKYGCIPNCKDRSYFVVRFDQKDVGYQGLEDRETGKDYAYNVIDGGTDSAKTPGTHLPDGFSMNPADTQLAWVELYKVDVKEKDKFVAQLDYEFEFNNTLDLKFGFKARDKERNASFSDEFYRWKDSAGPVPTLADFNLINQPGRNDYLDEVSGANYANDFSQVVSKEELINWYNANRDNLELVEDESALISNGDALGRNFDIEEQHLASYAMGTWSANDEISLVAGVRAERTETQVDGKVLNEDSGTIEDRRGENSYWSILPSAHLTYSPQDNINYRFAISRSFTRPDFGALNPGGSYFEADNKFTSGNAELDPTYSWNLDVMAEYYFENVGVVSGGVFYKSITDPIFTSSSIGTYKGRSGVDFVRPENGGDAKLWGMELAYSKQFDFLPGVFGNLGMNSNITLMDSEMDIDGRSDKVAIPRQADELYNISLYYDDSHLALRLAVNHKGEYIEEHGSNAQSDRYYGKYTGVDFSASYQLNDNFTLFAELNNLTNEPLKYYRGNEDRPLQTEYYGVRGQVGFKYNL